MLATCWSFSSFTGPPRSIFNKVFRSTPVLSDASVCVIPFLFSRSERAPGQGRFVILAIQTSNAEKCGPLNGERTAELLRIFMITLVEFSVRGGDFAGPIRLRGHADRRDLCHCGGPQRG